jgi:hypothetical protein
MAFCNRTCTRALGDVDTTGFFWVVSTAAEGRLRTQLFWLRERLRQKNHRVGRLARGRAEAVLKVEALQVLLDETQADLEQSAESRRALKGDLADARTRQGRERLLLATALVLVIVALIMLRFMLKARRRHRRFDEDLTRLLEEESVLQIGP